jgi:predicted amidophosphoribosyltransferase
MTDPGIPITQRSGEIRVSHWLLMILLGVMPVWWFVRWRRERKRAREGLCAACGYDLRATAQRCPECGRLIEGDGEKAAQVLAKT